MTIYVVPQRSIEHLGSFLPVLNNSKINGTTGRLTVKTIKMHGTDITKVYLYGNHKMCIILNTATSIKFLSVLPLIQQSTLQTLYLNTAINMMTKLEKINCFDC